MSMSLQTVETAPAVVTFPVDAPAAVPPASYQAVRFNAMKHGILSPAGVLAHEDGGDFDDLLAALVEEHRPAGMTEQHLVEELAAIIWRKRRVLMAEAAKINEGLKAVAEQCEVGRLRPHLFSVAWPTRTPGLQDLMTETPEQIAETQRDAELDLAATRKGGGDPVQRRAERLRQSPAGVAARLARLVASTDRGRGAPGDRGRAGAVHP
jgi:hypothetical protein